LCPGSSTTTYPASGAGVVVDVVVDTMVVVVVGPDVDVVGATEVVVVGAVVATVCEVVVDSPLPWPEHDANTRTRVRRRGFIVRGAY
jgi:hypothetical protein